MRLIEFISEASVPTYLAKSRAPLYHATSTIYFYDIIKSGKIDIRSYDKSVSLTRNPNLWYGENETGGADFQFQINADSLRTTHKLVPYDYFSDKDLSTFKRSESEEITNKVIPINKKYINKVLINKRYLESIKNYGEENVDELTREIYLAIQLLNNKYHIPVEYVTKIIDPTYKDKN